MRKGMRNEVIAYSFARNICINDAVSEIALAFIEDIEEMLKGNRRNGFV